MCYYYSKIKKTQNTKNKNKKHLSMTIIYSNVLFNMVNIQKQRIEDIHRIKKIAMVLTAYNDIRR